MTSLVCEPCEKVFSTEEENQQHQKTMLHQRNAQRYSKKFQVFVTAFGSSVTSNDLRAYFSQYGTVKNVFVDKKKKTFAFVEFVYESEMMRVLHCQHFLWGRRLVVKKSTSNFREKPTISSLSVDDLVSALACCTVVEEQIKVFCERVTLSPDDSDCRQNARKDLEDVLKKYYPNCKVHIFGSTENGFGFKGCDLDMLFEPHPNYYQECPQPPADAKTKDRFITVMDVEQGLVSPEELMQLSSREHVRFIGKVLQRHSAMFHHPIHIAARCPIVKFTSQKYSISCDISCSSRLVLWNTRLLRLYSQLDDRVMPLMRLLRYWSKLRGLIRPSCLSSYAFSMLILFFLQTREPSVVPSVLHLRQLAGPEDARIENGYDCSFCTDPNKVTPSQNKETLEELLLGFFKFYADFDFSFVVSTLEGQKMMRNAYEVNEGDEEHSFISSAIAIQDPLECDRNITAFVKAKALVQLKELMRLSLEMLSSKIAAHKDPSFGILTLLKEIKPDQQPLCLVHNEDVLPLPSHGLMYTLMFSEDYKDCLSDVDGTWMRKITSLLVDMFEYGLCFETEVIDKYDQILLPPLNRKRRADPGEDNCPAGKKPRLQEADVNGKAEAPKTPDPGCIPDAMPPQLLVSVQNIVEFNVWAKRRKVKASMDLQAQYGKGQALELEHAVTSQLLSEASKVSRTIYFTCDCYMHREQACDRLILSLQPTEFNREFLAMAPFLRGFTIQLLNDALLHQGR